MKFRIKHVDGVGCFAQVKFHFFTKWFNISENYLLYEKDCYSHTVDTPKAAKIIIEKYKQLQAEKRLKSQTPQVWYTYL